MCYASQFYNPASREPKTFISEKRFIEHLETRARYYGFEIGADYGEPFYSERVVRMSLSNLF